jgi:hypothetical protein
MVELIHSINNVAVRSVITLGNVGNSDLGLTSNHLSVVVLDTFDAK